MLEYQNIFTRVQVHGPPGPGMPIDETSATPRKGNFLLLAGQDRRRADRPRSISASGHRLADLRLHRHRDHRPQHAGLGELDPIEFMRQLPWLALEPPPPKYGLAFRRWRRRLVADGRLLPHDASILLWWAAHLPPRPRARHGHACRLGLRRGDLALSRAGLHPPAADGQLERSRAVRHLPAPRLDAASRSATATCSTIRSTCSRSPSSMARHCCSPCMARRSSR
jgi:hypothetical protein